MYVLYSMSLFISVSSSFDHSCASSYIVSAIFTSLGSSGAFSTASCSLALFCYFSYFSDKVCSRGRVPNICTGNYRTFNNMLTELLVPVQVIIFSVSFFVKYIFCKIVLVFVPNS
jgi:hypothetical protein